MADDATEDVIDQEWWSDFIADSWCPTDFVKVRKLEKVVIKLAGNRRTECGSRAFAHRHSSGSPAKGIYSQPDMYIYVHLVIAVLCLIYFTALFYISYGEKNRPNRPFASGKTVADSKFSRSECLETEIKCT